MPPVKLEVEWRVASSTKNTVCALHQYEHTLTLLPQPQLTSRGDLLVVSSRGEPSSDVVLRHLLTGRALWRSALGNHKIEDLVTTDDGYVIGASSTTGDVLILKVRSMHGDRS